MWGVAGISGLRVEPGARSAIVLTSCLSGEESNAPRAGWTSLWSVGGCKLSSVTLALLRRQSSAFVMRRSSVQV
jgi:hypothetical protein